MSCKQGGWGFDESDKIGKYEEIGNDSHIPEMNNKWTIDCVLRSNSPFHCFTEMSDDAIFKQMSVHKLVEGDYDEHCLHSV